MLKSKAGFKPKAKAVPRRNAPASSSQTNGASSTSASHTPAPAPTPPASVDQEALQSLPPTTAATISLSNAKTSTISPVVTPEVEGSSSRGQEESTSSRGQAGVTRQPNGTLPTGTTNHSERPPPTDEETLTSLRRSVPQLPVPTAGISSVAAPDVPRSDSQLSIASTPAPPQVAQPPPEPTTASTTAALSILSTVPSTRPTRSNSPSTPASSVAVSQTQPTQPLPPTAGLDEPQPTIQTTRPESATAEPSGASKQKRPQKRKADNATETLPGQEGSSAPPAKRPRAKRAAPLPGEEGYEAGQTATKPKRTRKRKVPTGTEDVTEDAETDSAAPSKRSSRQREATPEDAETIQIDIEQVKMADLARDMHIGKKFSLHDKLLEQERLKRQKASEKKRQKKNGSGDEEGVPGGDVSISKTKDNAEATLVGDKADGTNGEASGRTSGQLAPVGEQYQIVDGVIVVDARSLQVDRHARAAEEAGELEEQEENDFTNHVTSSTYLRRNLKPQQWTEEETEQFYRALSSWGTDFETISKMFHNKTRKHVKLKFNREERANPQRINDTLIGKKTATMNIEDYQRHTGMQYETTEAIDAELKKNQEEFDAREKAVKEAQAEENRKKREALFGAPEDGAEDGDGGKKKRGRKKAKVSQAYL